MTVVLNLGGGAGCGKSVLAALLYGEMKIRGYSVELVREYIKSWAFEGRPIRKDDELYIFAKQLRQESPLYHRVDWIITDRPLWLSVVYEKFFESGTIVAEVEKGVMETQKADGIQHIELLVKRQHPYVQEGRYQNEREAKVVDALCMEVRPNLTEVGSVADVLSIVQSFPR